MMRMKNIRLFLLCAMLCALCVAPASALEYTVAPPDDYTFGRPTSEDTIYEEKGPNVDRSKHTALIPPAFGSPTSYLPSSGEALTQNLLPGRLSAVWSTPFPAPKRPVLKLTVAVPGLKAPQLSPMSPVTSTKAAATWAR